MSFFQFVGECDKLLSGAEQMAAAELVFIPSLFIQSSFSAAYRRLT